MISLKKLLTDEGPLTARQIAKRMRCSMPTVYARVRALQAEGVPVTIERSPVARPGPTPQRFVIRPRT